MPRILRLMDEDDLPQVKAVVAEAFMPPASVCKLDFQYDGGERLFLTVETDIPASEIGDIHRKIVIPLLGRLDDEFGEFGFEMRALCECGRVATPRFSSDPENDMCLCGKCLSKKIDEHRDGPRNTCPVCEKGFDGIKSPGWSSRCSARLGSQEDGAKPEMDIGTIRIGRTDVNKWDCCSRKCALEQFRKWLSKVESHPVARESVTLT